MSEGGISLEQKKPQFRMMKNGYDRFAVDNAVERYVQEIEALKKQQDLTRRQIQSANEQLAVIRQRYQTLVSELTVKEKAADDIARLALKEANTIIETAQNNADAIVREALVTARSILADLTRITSEAAQAKSGMKEQLTSLMESLDHFEIPPVPKSEWIEDSTGEETGRA